MDAKNCMNLASFHPDKLCGGFCEEMVLQAREKLLINRVSTGKLLIDMVKVQGNCLLTGSVQGNCLLKWSVQRN